MTLQITKKFEEVLFLYLKNGTKIEFDKGVLTTPFGKFDKITRIEISGEDNNDY